MRDNLAVLSIAHIFGRGLPSNSTISSLHLLIETQCRSTGARNGLSCPPPPYPAVWAKKNHVHHTTPPYESARAVAWSQGDRPSNERVWSPHPDRPWERRVRAFDNPPLIVVAHHMHQKLPCSRKHMPPASLPASSLKRHLSILGARAR